MIRSRAGLPPATYFSGGKIAWILDNVDGVRADAEAGDAIFGTTDSWLIWNLTGGVDGGLHVTDVTNASRTMLMDLETLDWDEELLSFFDIPRACCPRSSPRQTRTGSAAAVLARGSSRGCRSAAYWATSRRRWSARSALPPARPRTLTAPATSCC